MVEVPAGPFVMGSSNDDEEADDDEKPQHSLDLPTYWIGRYPVTVAQWRVFVADGGYKAREYWTDAGWEYVSGTSTMMALSPPQRRWSLFRRKPVQRPCKPVRWGGPETGDDNLPITEITWHEAVAYCRWLSAKTGDDYQLPTEAQWEKAARGPQGLIYPWGNNWQQGLCNSKELGLGRTSPVGSFPAGASPYGAEDMAGNIWEWCVTKYRKSYPYDVHEDEWDAAYLEGEDGRKLRGGAYWKDQQATRGSYRYVTLPRCRNVNIGLRVARCSPRPRPGS